ncbi:MAG TPA: hypothetical protein VN515_01795, partial [Terriglobales bacterium]|nr:hypothetical protein [Terriglobales bacterium]
MPWHEFLGNAEVVAQLRHLVAAQHARRTVVLTGPEGIGKTTLALMLGLALNCLAPPAPGDFCGVCTRCRQAVSLSQVAEQITAALEFREAEVKGNAREAAPLQVSLHPAVRLYPPDGDFLTMAQARALIQQTQLLPDAGATWTLIVPEFDRARWTTQAALLKTLEEPPERVCLVMLARNPLALLPTVRSRALVLALRPVASEELVAALAQRSPAAPEELALAARLSQGCPGRALQLDLAGYRAARQEALGWLRAALAGGQALSVFRLSESTRASKEKFESLLEILYSVLQD